MEQRQCCPNEGTTSHQPNLFKAQEEISSRALLGKKHDICKLTDDGVFMCLSLSVWEKTSAPLLHKHAHSLQEEEKTRFKVGMCWMTNFPALLLFSFVSQLLWSPRSCERSLHSCLFHGYPGTFINATHLDSDSMDFLFLKKKKKEKKKKGDLEGKHWVCVYMHTRQLRLQLFSVITSFTLNLLSCRTFLMATSSPESQSLAW